MIQQLKLYCVDCGARAFYGSSRGPVCHEHKWNKKNGTNKANEIHSKRRPRIDWPRD
jgi:hypothetical protein